VGLTIFDEGGFEAVDEFLVAAVWKSVELIATVQLQGLCVGLPSEGLAGARVIISALACELSTVGPSPLGSGVLFGALRDMSQRSLGELGVFARKSPCAGW
jgi:hypothetical protein